MERQASASSLSVTTRPRMVDLHAVIAARNNADWYETMFQVHGLAYTRGRSTFVTDAPPPRFHSHMLALDPRCSPATLNEIKAQSVKENFGIKDAFDAYDLAPLGLSPLFEARWIWADRLPVQDTADWSKVTNADQLLAFEIAWKNQWRFNPGIRYNYEYLDTELEFTDDISIPVGGYNFIQPNIEFSSPFSGRLQKHEGNEEWPIHRVSSPACVG